MGSQFTRLNRSKTEKNHINFTLNIIQNNPLLKVTMLAKVRPQKYSTSLLHCLKLKFRVVTITIIRKK